MKKIIMFLYLMVVLQIFLLLISNAHAETITFALGPSGVTPMYESYPLEADAVIFGWDYIKYKKWKDGHPDWKIVKRDVIQKGGFEWDILTYESPEKEKNCWWEYKTFIGTPNHLSDEWKYVEMSIQKFVRTPFDSGVTQTEAEFIPSYVFRRWVCEGE